MNAAGTIALDRQPAHAAAGRELEARVTKGRPLIMLGLLAGTWALARAVLWETPFPQMPTALEPMSAQIFAAEAATAEQAEPKEATEKVSAQASAMSSAPQLNPPAYWTIEAHSRSVDAPLLMLASSTEVRVQTAAPHQLMWMAAMAYMPVPRVDRGANVPPSNAHALTSQPKILAIARKADANRWSLDAWTFWRQGSGSPLVALGEAPSYGASQAGAVLRYELQPSNARRPRAYLRAYSSLEGRKEQEVAAGLSARLLPQLPLRLHAEARGLRSAAGAAGQSTGTASGRRLSTRAAAFVTTELPTARLPAGLTAEAYGQAGYVTGKNSTAFADGQAHILREIASFDLAKIEVGGAAFAGAQKGVHRVDIGPAMRVNLSLGETQARLSASYRAKVAGDAQPGSGVAVALSTRF